MQGHDRAADDVAPEIVPRPSPLLNSPFQHVAERAFTAERPLPEHRRSPFTPQKGVNGIDPISIYPYYGANGRPRLTKVGSEPSLKRASSGPQLRAKSQALRNGRLPEHSHKPPVAPTKVSATGKTPAQLHKAASKLEKAKDRSRERSTTLRHTLSWSELHFPQESQAKCTGVNSLSKQASVTNPKRLLQKLTSAPSGLPKIPVRLPVLAPLESKILAAVGQRAWIRINDKGEASLFKKDKHVVTHELGIQIRDLRLLDPLMTSTYPSAILCRDKALVVNLEYIRCIITQDSTYILDADQSMVRTFVQQLQKRVKDSCLPTKSSGTAKASKILQETTSTLPYELRVLEAAIDNVCKHLESQYIDLDVAMRPMLKTHTASKVTSHYLERFRRLKTSLVRLKTRVETLKGVLDRILAAESDMKAIHLTGRMREQKVAVLRRLARQSLRESGTPNQGPDLQRSSKGIPQDEIRQEEEEREVAEVEMLLGAYYMNLDSTLNKLTDISEFVEDAEELMDLEMDTYRNNMIKVRVFLGTCHMFAGAIWAILNIFGMNLGLNYNVLMGDTYPRFKQVVITSISASAGLMLVLIGILHSKQLSITTVVK